VEDRIAPVIEADALGEELGAHAVAVAGDGVEAETVAHSASSSLQPWPERWRPISSAKTASPLRSRRTAPLGRWQAPLPSTWPAHRMSRSTVSSPWNKSAAPPAMAARPCTHDPHWPADSLAYQPRMRAVSFSPQA